MCQTKLSRSFSTTCRRPHILRLHTVLAVFLCLFDASKPCEYERADMKKHSLGAVGLLCVGGAKLASYDTVEFARWRRAKHSECEPISD
jgi:hypothetical protein